MAHWVRPASTGLRFLYAFFWVAVPLSTWLFGVEPPPQPTAEARAFWDAIAATGFMTPLLGINYLIAGILCFVERTTPLGLALISPALFIAALFDAFLVRGAGPWILIVIAHLWLMWVHRSAYVPMWTYGARSAPAAAMTTD